MGSPSNRISRFPPHFILLSTGLLIALLLVSFVAAHADTPGEINNNAGEHSTNLAPGVQEQAIIPMVMGSPPVPYLCNYKLVLYNREHLLTPEGEFDPTALDVAKLCNTKVFVRLHGLTSDIMGAAGGLDLVKYEDQINDFAGHIDPYVGNGVIVSHLTIDEPHDCSDWANVCPYQSEVDQASQISKLYWPTLKTWVNTMPGYAAGYNWVSTDVINFTYAYHKGPLNDFVAAATYVLANGYVDEISWGMQAKSGGCEVFNECSMTPAQVMEVGNAFCETHIGQAIGFNKYSADLIDESMQQTIDDLRVYCGETLGEPPTPFSVTGRVYSDFNKNNEFDPVTEVPLPRVVISLTAVTSGAHYTATTAGSGNYIIPNLAPDTYSIDLVDSSLPAGHVNVRHVDIVVGESASVIFDFPVRVNSLAGLVFLPVLFSSM